MVVVVATLLDEAVHFLPLLFSLMEPPQLVLEAVDNKLIHLGKKEMIFILSFLCMTLYVLVTSLR